MRIGGDPEKIEMLQEENFSHYRDEVHYFEDVYPTVRDPEKFGLRLCIVTSSRKSMLEKMDLPVKDYVCIDDVVRGKSKKNRRRSCRYNERPSQQGCEVNNRGRCSPGS